MAHSSQLAALFIILCGVRQGCAESGTPTAFADWLVPADSSHVSASEPVFNPKSGKVTGSTSAFFPHSFGNFLPVSVTHRVLTPVKNAVIILSEWWGVSSAELRIAARLSDMGYFVALPNIYREQLPFDHRFDDLHDGALVDQVAREVVAAAWKMKTLAWGGHGDYVLDLVSYLKGVQGMQKVALLGFSEGACLSLITASMSSTNRNASIDGVVALYGSPLKNGERLTGNASDYFEASRLKQQVLLLTGDQDTFAGFSSPSSMQEVRHAIGETAEFIEIPNAGHGFMSDAAWWESWKAAQEPPRAPFSQAAYDETWSHISTFFAKLFQGDTNTEFM